ncbi:hypothetical protein QYM36_013288 [Artemia franciscana]|uniref:Uncharacterized protein n=2 Tax=Artemia franciscana TaxID=6661 RepID=A0AA88HPR7_ARTSF|nr:hypothetical protein QYM36_013288 [Artemia franciscana]
MKCRTTFYTSLGRLLMVDLGEDEERFEQFMLPLRGSFDILAQMLSQADSPVFRNDEAQKLVIGVARDLRGVAYALNTKIAFMMLFEWIYPTYTDLLIRSIQLWYSEPQVTTPILKFFAELVQNRSQRLHFDVSSPNGVLLFREASKVICSYGTRILNVEIPKERIYSMKLKGVSICFVMLKATLAGNYVNFGVFRLYGDDALENVLQTFIKLLSSIPQNDLLEYPKLSQSYYFLLECLTSDHMVFIGSLEAPVFLYLLATISEGLGALGGNINPFADTMVCTSCCNALDNIVTYIFKQVTAKAKRRAVTSASSANVLSILEQRPEILQQLLATVLNIIMFEECRNQFSMSRPLLGLVLLNSDYFTQLRNTIISSQPPDKQSLMAQGFENLMDGIESNLMAKNRDR